MGLFGKKDNANQVLAAPLDRIAAVLEKTSQPDHEVLSEEEKIRAAYALNLCLVSVSQIIDYADVYVLEQEYEGILNNLNLEHMPKDEALLDILRQILDTITFFRIQEEDKKHLEKEYQNRMRTAIWSAVPNCGVILACADPKVMLVSLVTQVGTGYMNYRRTKAEAQTEKGKGLWELNKAAIEQFNGLRRELFTTAWKLAEKYGFKDKYRLTESQIAQYNRILQEGNLYRRLVLLRDIKEKFKAYPPFWYFKGHTALLLAAEGFDSLEMRKEARESFDEYFAINGKNSELLRNDPICAACALEYITLLEECEASTKASYIERAIQCAGNHLDVLQMCAMAYIDLGMLDRAAKILRNLVCERYNEAVNAQLLCLIYVNDQKRMNGESSYQVEYQLLSKITDPKVLIPWPSEKSASVNDCYREFIANSKERILDGCANFINKYYSKKADECRLILMDETENKEAALVRFIKKMGREIAYFPGTKITDHNTFVDLLADKEEALKTLLNGFTTKRFEDAFGSIFLTVAGNISSCDLSTMEAITQFELCLVEAVGKYGATVECLQDEDTLNALLRCEDTTSDTFKMVKAIISRRKDSLVKRGAERTKLLIAGEQECYDYIKRHMLSKNEVVAVINDQTLNDCDLIFMEDGLLVHDGLSLAASGMRFAVFGIYELINRGLRSVIANKIPYATVEYEEDRIKKPKYKNKDVNTDELFGLINEIKCGAEGSIESRIAKAIKGNNE